MQMRRHAFHQRPGQHSALRLGSLLFSLLLWCGVLGMGATAGKLPDALLRGVNPAGEEEELSKNKLSRFEKLWGKPRQSIVHLMYHVLGLESQRVCCRANGEGFMLLSAPCEGHSPPGCGSGSSRGMLPAVLAILVCFLSGPRCRLNKRPAEVL
jgi:hypothetical protein